MTEPKRLPRNEKGQFIPLKCPVEGCDGELVFDPHDFGGGRWHCNGLVDRGECFPLEACTFSHSDGDYRQDD